MNPESKKDAIRCITYVLRRISELKIKAKALRFVALRQILEKLGEIKLSPDLLELYGYPVYTPVKPVQDVDLLHISDLYDTAQLVKQYSEYNIKPELAFINELMFTIRWLTPDIEVETGIIVAKDGKVCQPAGSFIYTCEGGTNVAILNKVFRTALETIHSIASKSGFGYECPFVGRVENLISIAQHSWFEVVISGVNTSGEYYIGGRKYHLDAGYWLIGPDGAYPVNIFEENPNLIGWTRDCREGKKDACENIKNYIAEQCGKAGTS